MNVDIAFMLDATRSMRKNLIAVEHNIGDVVRQVRAVFNNTNLRVALVAYRDYTNGAHHFRTMNFTSSIQEFVSVLGQVRAFKGGDVPEDVLGALDKTINLDWKAANRIFYQIGMLCETEYHLQIQT